MREKWTNREIQVLEQLSMDLPTDLIHQAYNAWASRNDAPLRSRKALMHRSRINEMVVNRACGEWVKTSYIANLLKLNSETLLYWLNRYKIPCHRDSRNWFYFRRRDLVKAAISYPIIFKGAKADDLFTLLEDRELANRVASFRSRKGNDPKPVRLIETGKVYSSIKQAAASVYVTHRAISHAIKTGDPIAGYHWTFA